MRPIDLRNATWADCLQHVTDDMLRVHAAWLAHGPCTTRALAARAGLSLLTVRPRTTDLYKLGLVDLVAREANEGVYAHRDRLAAEQAGHWRTRADFRRASGPGPAESTTPVIQGYPTVEAAINSLSLADRAALGARLMARYGTLLKRHEAARADQLTLLPTT